MQPAPLTPACLAPFWKRFRQYVAANRPNDGSWLGINNAPRIGLCVSGGPDSMALAYLLSNYVKERPGYADLRQVRAFVVDHNARKGSREEAEKVAGWLEDMNITTTIQTMAWTSDDPSKLSNFELEARVRRYRHLAVHAANKHIRHLFTGHHQDDQVETLLMRLVRGKNPTVLSFLGMQETSPIPECASYRGARNREPSRPLASLLRESRTELRNNAAHIDALTEQRVGQVINTAMDWVRGLEHGGIMVHRPLLPYTKAQLIATCVANKVPFVTDKSNADPSFTQRNAIRILREARLPRALQPASLLRFADNALATKTHIEQRALGYLHQISILGFDFRSGTVDIRIPRTFAEFARSDRNAAAAVIAQLAALVCPLSPDRLPTLATSTTVQQFALALDSRGQNDHQVRKPALSYNEVLFSALSRADVRGTIWRLTRAPMTEKAVGHATHSFMLRAKIRGPPVRSDPFAADHSKDKAYKEEQDMHVQGWSKWLFWDFRYWIRVRVAQPDLLRHVRVRPYHRSDVRILSERMFEGDFDQLLEILHKCATGKTRFTLPILTLNDEVVAFPTLFREMVNLPGYKAQLRELGVDHNPGLYWEVAYRLLPKTVAEWGSSATILRDNAMTQSELQAPERRTPSHYVLGEKGNLWRPPAEQPTQPVERLLHQHEQQNTLPAEEARMKDSIFLKLEPAPHGHSISAGRTNVSAAAMMRSSDGSPSLALFDDSPLHQSVANTQQVRKGPRQRKTHDTVSNQSSNFSDHEVEHRHGHG